MYRSAARPPPTGMDPLAELPPALLDAMTPAERLAYLTALAEEPPPPPWWAPLLLATRTAERPATSR
jgi:hypothetical protein